MAINGAFDHGERIRLWILGLALVAPAAVILQHLYWYQLVDQPRLGALATEEHQHRRPLPPQRGTLLDTHGYPLAVTVTYHGVFVYAPYVRDRDHTAALLAEILEIPKEEVLARIRQADRQWTALARRVPANTVSRIEAAQLPGVQVQPVPVREYPEGSMAAQVLGFVGTDGRGLSGLELTLDEELRGTPGLLVSEQDTDGAEIAIGRKQRVLPLPGSDVILTIDRQIQRAAERVLASTVREQRASGGVILVMEPASGALLAMASQPTYTLSRDLAVDAGRQHLYKPLAVTDTYEPGSVMKLVTVAAAIEEQVVGPESWYQDTGVATVDGTPIRNWDGQGYGSVTVRQILMYSLNTGAQWIARQVGAEKFYGYLEAFGFGAPTRVPLNGEAAGSFRRPDDPAWSRLDLATNAFGQSIAATPLQVLSAVAALGNGGVRMQPQLVQEIRGPAGMRTIEPQPVRRVVSPATAETLVDMMVATWSQPALQAHHLPGYSLAGKSGTADIPGPGGYNSGKTYGSFVALGPIPNPRFAIFVRVDHPVSTWGGQAAAPAVRALAEELFRYLGIPPNGGHRA